MTEPKLPYQEFVNRRATFDWMLARMDLTRDQQQSMRSGEYREFFDYSYKPDSKSTADVGLSKLELIK